jgi:hypothetical protein
MADTSYSKLPHDAEEAIIEGARKDRADRWDPESGLERADNAHRTNTAKEMAEAIADRGHNFLEGDIRLDGNGRAVMAHDSGSHDGMSLAQWLEIATESGKGMKMELKEAAAVDAVIAAAARYPQHADKMMFNVTLGDGGVTTEQIHQLNAAFPNSMMAFSSSEGGLDAGEIARLQRAAEIIGDPERVSFPVENEGMTEQTVKSLEPYGKVSVWNMPELHPFYDAGDIENETDRFRSMGAEGMIDLREGSLAMDMPSVDMPDLPKPPPAPQKPSLSDLPDSGSQVAAKSDSSVPRLSSMEGDGGFDMPGIDMPDVSMPDIDVPDIHMPKVDLPSFGL